MPDGYKQGLDGKAAFPFRGSQTPVFLQDIQQDLARAWHLTLASQIDQALTVFESIERRLDGLSPPVATRYRAASHLVRSAVVAFQDDSLAVLAIVNARIAGTEISAIEKTDLGVTASALLGSLGLLFVPAGVGIVQQLPLIGAYALLALGIVTKSTSSVCIAATLRTNVAVVEVSLALLCVAAGI